MLDNQLYKTVTNFIMIKKPLNIKIGTNIFTNLMYYSNLLNYATEQQFLNENFIGVYLGTNLWLDNELKLNNIKLNNHDVFNYNEGWSLPIDLNWNINDIERIWSMSALW